jgi:hypothetical protein
MKIFNCCANAAKNSFVIFNLFFFGAQLPEIREDLLRTQFEIKITENAAN